MRVERLTPSALLCIKSFYYYYFFKSSMCAPLALKYSFGSFHWIQITHAALLKTATAMKEIIGPINKFIKNLATA